MGQSMAQTARSGRMVLMRVLARNQTVIWDFMDGPTRESTFRAIRRSRPMETQGRVMRPEPKTRMMLSQEYWEMTSVMGTMLRKALAMAGINAVMVISTGPVIHQKIIYREMPMACAPDVVNRSRSSSADSAKITGPKIKQMKRFLLLMANSPLFF